jgi:hypothetical protein
MKQLQYEKRFSKEREEVWADIEERQKLGYTESYAISTLVDRVAHLTVRLEALMEAMTGLGTTK